MKLSMFRLGWKNMQIIRRIIGFIKVDMMHDFLFSQISFKNLLGNKARFNNILFFFRDKRMIWSINKDFAIFSNYPSTFPMDRFFTKQRILAHMMLGSIIFTFSRYAYFIFYFLWVFFTEKIASIISTYFFAYFRRPFAVYHTYMITMRRTKDFFTSSLPCRAGFKDFVTYGTLV